MLGVPVVPDEGPAYLPMLSPGFFNRIPDHVPTFEADVATLARIKEARYEVRNFVPVPGRYEWCTDLACLEGTGKPQVIGGKVDGVLTCFL